jgi:hypothetical protein
VSRVNPVNRVNQIVALWYLATLAVCGAAFAQTPAPPSPPPAASASQGPQIKIGSTIFADFTETLKPEAKDTAGQAYRPNAFNVTRAYVTVAGAFNPVFSFRATTDIARESSTGDSLDGSYVARLKYAYAQITLDKWTGHFTETWVRFGLTPTPFVEGRDASYRYRWWGALMPEKEGLIISADTGVSFHTAFPKNYGDVQVSVVNGEGYQKPEVNNQKALQTRVTARPLAQSSSEFLKAFRVTWFYDLDHYMANADRKRGIYAVSYENGHANAGAEILRSHDEVTPGAGRVNGDGWDIFVTPFFKAKGNGPEALIRFDHWQPDTAKSDVRERTVLGLSYWWTQKSTGVSAAVMLDYEGVTVKDPTFLQPDQRRLALHTVLSF